MPGTIAVEYVQSIVSTTNSIDGLVVGQREMHISVESETALVEIENRPSAITHEIRGVREVRDVADI